MYQLGEQLEQPGTTVLQNAGSTVTNPEKTGVKSNSSFKILAVSLTALAVVALVFAEIKYKAVTFCLALAAAHPLITAGIVVALVVIGIVTYVVIQRRNKTAENKAPESSTSSSTAQSTISQSTESRGVRNYGISESTTNSGDFSAPLHNFTSSIELGNGHVAGNVYGFTGTIPTSNPFQGVLGLQNNNNVGNNAANTINNIGTNPVVPAPRIRHTVDDHNNAELGRVKGELRHLYASSAISQACHFMEEQDFSAAERALMRDLDTLENADWDQALATSIQGRLMHLNGIARSIALAEAAIKYQRRPEIAYARQPTWEALVTEEVRQSNANKAAFFLEITNTLLDDNQLISKPFLLEAAVRATVNRDAQMVSRFLDKLLEQTHLTFAERDCALCCAARLGDLQMINRVLACATQGIEPGFISLPQSAGDYDSPYGLAIFLATKAVDQQGTPDGNAILGLLNRLFDHLNGRNSSFSLDFFRDLGRAVPDCNEKPQILELLGQRRNAAPDNQYFSQ